MKVYYQVYLEWDEALQRYVKSPEGEISEEYTGPVAMCCGASSQMKQIGSEQSSFFQQLTQQAGSVFGKASGVFNDLVKTFTPVVAAGPNQEGFSGAEKTAMFTMANEGTAQTYNKASAALEKGLAARGGGNAYIPSGADDQLRETLASSAAAQESNAKNQIVQEDYATGRDNWLKAAAGLSGATNVFNPVTGMNDSATSAGNAAEKTENEIQQADNSWVGAVTGMAGGILGSVATGGMKNLGAGVGFFGQNAPAPTSA